MQLSYRRIKALIRKESFQIRRDFSSILISVVIPVLLLFLYGYGVSLDLNHLRIGLVLEDTSPKVQSLAHAFTNSSYFEVSVARDERELQGKLVSGRLRGIVVIPAYFSSFYESKTRIAPIQVIADGSEPNTAAYVQNYTLGAVERWMDASSIHVETRYWYNEELESRKFLIPGSMAIIMALIGTLLTALVVAREWERGTMEALMSTEVTIYEILFAKFVSYFVLGMISMALCVGIAVLFYQIPFRGSFFLLALSAAAFLFCALGTGLFISILSKNQIVASQIAILTGFLPAYILSGFLFEITGMPPWIQALTFLMPARYFVQSLQTLFLVGNVFSIVLFNLLVMLGMGLLIFWIAKRYMVKRLDS